MHPQCLLCKADASIDETWTNPQIAREFGVSKDSARRHRKHISGPTATPTAHNAVADPPDIDSLYRAYDPYFKDVPREVITSRGRTVRLMDGSYEKVTYSPAKMAVAEARLSTYADLEAALKGFTATRPLRTATPAATRNKARVLNMADLQVGKVDWNGGTPELLERVRRGVDRFAALCEAEQPQAIVLVDNGDPIENVFNVATQRHTNDLSVPEQIRVYRRVMIETLKRLAPLAPDIFYVAVTSNHGAFRTGFKEQGGTTDADFGLDIAEQLRDVCSEAASEALRAVTFVVPDPWQEVAVLDVCGTRLAFTHGHLSPSFKTHSQWWARIDHGRLPGWDADILVTAHYHSLKVEQSGDGRWILSVSSPDNGSSWFSKSQGEQAVSGITTFAVSGGKWSDLEIL